jgi:hypothetical protein
MGATKGQRNNNEILLKKIIIGYWKSGHGVGEHRPMALSRAICTHGYLIYA